MLARSESFWITWECPKMSGSSKPRILVVEDQPSEREALARLLRLEHYEVATAESAKQALSFLHEPIDLVISDLKMSKATGLDLLRYWKEQRRETPFIVVTAFGEVGSAVEAMKLGAEDYLNKPVNPEELLLLVARCLESRRKDRTISELQTRLDERLGFERIIGRSEAMLAVFDQARRAAMTETTVLVTGESGTGKEMIAEAIHQNSPRRDGPFVTVNMAAVPSHLVESELFGHIQGAFTGATCSRVGRFESANRGTIFIDEIGDFASESQAKLLRVLENRTVTPIGSNDDRSVDVRIVAATSRDLTAMVACGEFREDLYYRLNVVNLQLPPLRERREDITLLVEHFLRDLAQRLDRPRLSIAGPLREFLETYDWPGNIRQLRNALESMAVLASGDRLTIDDLPATLHDSSRRNDSLSIPSGMSLEDLQREAVEQALAQHEGNRTHAAAALGISVRTLQRKLKAWELDDHGRC
jgi:DNA-binding NtrC family response regulator